MDNTQLEKLILASIDQRYQAHTTRDLADYIFSNYLFQSFQPAFIGFIGRYGPDIAVYLADPGHVQALVGYCMRATKAYTYQRNQFINFTGFYDELLAAEYTRFFEQIREMLAQTTTIEGLTAATATVLQAHHERLRLVLSSYCVAAQPAKLNANPLLSTVPCEEYSAALQLRLLGLDPAALAEPILDIGCGASGALVTALRQQGYTAFGLDRLAPVGPAFFQQNWFEFDFGANRWGTIVAHQSFSTHFIHAHLHNSTSATQFARLTMQILGGLKPGGEFCYAPGLPFFEPHIESSREFAVAKTTIQAGNTLGIGEIFYAARVKKLSPT